MGLGWGDDGRRTSMERVYRTVRVEPMELATREEALRVAAAITGAVPEAKVTIGECEVYDYVPGKENERPTDQIDTIVLIRDIEEAGVEIWSTRDGRRITLSDAPRSCWPPWRPGAMRASGRRPPRACATSRRPGSSAATWSAAACTATRTSACRA